MRSLLAIAFLITSISFRAHADLCPGDFVDQPGLDSPVTYYITKGPELKVNSEKFVKVNLEYYGNIIAGEYHLLSGYDWGEATVPHNVKIDKTTLTIESCKGATLSAPKKAVVLEKKNTSEIYIYDGKNLVKIGIEVGAFNNHINFGRNVWRIGGLSDNEYGDCTIYAKPDESLSDILLSSHATVEFHVSSPSCLPAYDPATEPDNSASLPDEGDQYPLQHD